VAKDFYVVRAIAALAAIDVTPFDLVFGGGTALARAHRIIQRMSEDMDFKIAAEKVVSLTRRTAMEMAGATRDPDPTLVPISMICI
jgi:hypothetical protein